MIIVSTNHTRYKILLFICHIIMMMTMICNVSTLVKSFELVEIGQSWWRREGKEGSEEEREKGRGEGERGERRAGSGEREA